jgi:hypothetical protein
MSRFARQIAAAVTLAAVVSATAEAQTRVVSTPSAVLGAPKGKAIGSVHPGVSVRVLETRGAYAKVSIDGFVERVRLSAERRSQSPRVGSRAAVVRSRGTASAKSVASLDAGTSVVVRTGDAPSGWVRVSREGWVLLSALDRSPPAEVARSSPSARRNATAGKTSSRKASAGEVAASPAPRKAATATPTVAKKPPAPATRPAATPAPSRVAAAAASSAPLSDSTLVPTSNIALRAAPDARPLATIAQGTTLVPLARDRGWVRVRVEGWVLERDVAPADTSVRSGVSAADLRADPVGSRGMVVRWAVQILAKQKADVLRRDLAPDEVYLLARGPNEENALLYLVVPASLMTSTKAMPELTQAMITARVRTGKSELVGVPILDLLSITPRK